MAWESGAGAANWRRGVAICALAQLLSVMGFSCATAFLPLYVQTLGVASPDTAAVWAGVMFFASAFAVALCSPFWGTVADRYGAKLMVERAMFGGAVVIGAMSLVHHAEHLLVLFVIQGFFTGINTAIATLVAGLAPRERLGAALGLCQTAVFAGMSVGPLLGGLLADAYSYRVGVASGAGLLLLGGLCVLLGTREPARAPAPAGARPGLLTGLRPALASRPLLLVIALIFLVQFATQMIGPVLPIFVQQLVGPGGRVATLTGLALAAGGVAAALSAVALGRVADRLGHHRILAWATLGGALATAPQALVGAFAPFLALRAAAGLFAGGLTTSTSAAIGLLTTPGRRGAAFGVAGSAFSLGNALGPLLGGLLTAAAGPRAPFAAAAVALALGWLVVRALAGARAPEGRPAVGAGGHP